MKVQYNDRSSYEIDRTRGAEADFRATEEVVREFYAREMAKDFAGFMDLFADDAVYEIPLGESGSNEDGDFRVFRGKQAINDFMVFAMGTWRTMAYNDLKVSLTADGAGAYCDARGDVVLERNGASYRNRYLYEFRVADGKITLMRQYYNPITSAIAMDRPIAGVKAAAA